MTGVVYYIRNSKEKLDNNEAAGYYKFCERADPENVESNHFEYVFVDTFRLEWVNQQDADHNNLTIKKWDHRDVDDDSNINCGDCLCCDIRSRDFTKCQYVVFVISSHGVEDQEPMVIMSDGHPLYLSEIVDALSDTECPSLAGKTRIIVVQACRTHEDEPGMDTGVTVQVLTNKTGNATPTQRPPVRPKRVVNVETPMDFLIVFAVPSGIKAMRDPKIQSWILADLASIMKHKVNDFDVDQVNFLQILSETNNLVCQRVGYCQMKDENNAPVEDAAGNVVIEEYKNTMCIYHRLTKQPVFNIPR